MDSGPLQIQRATTTNENTVKAALGGRAHCKKEMNIEKRWNLFHTRDVMFILKLYVVFCGVAASPSFYRVGI